MDSQNTDSQNINSQKFLHGDNSRITIVLDRTASMDFILQTMIEGLAGYIIRRSIESPIDSLCLITFDDHYWGNIKNPIKVYEPTDNLEEFMFNLHSVELGHGDDIPEAIACALHYARNVHSDSDIWLITDTLPHGILIDADAYPEGCPCNIPLSFNNVKGVVYCVTSEYDLFALNYWKKYIKNVVEVTSTGFEHILKS